MTNRLRTDAWGTADYIDRIEELVEMGDFAAADKAIVAALGETVAWHGKRYYTRGLLWGRWEEATRVGQGKTRGWTRIAGESKEDNPPSVGFFSFEFPPIIP